MAFQTGVPASTASLIDTYISWIVTQCGFTLGNTWSFTADSTYGYTSGSTNWTARALLRDSQYVYLAWPTTNPDKITLNTGTNNPTTSRINQQTECYAYNMRVDLGTAPQRYWMFADGYSAHCVVEWKGGAFQHIHMGYVEKYGTWAGGVYVGGAYNNSTDHSSGNYYDILDYQHVNPFGFPSSGSSSYGNYANASIRCTYESVTVRSFGGGDGFVLPGLLHGFGIINNDQPNSYNGRAVLTPIELAVRDDASNYYLRPIGRVSNCALINIANINPTDTILTDWMAFPWSAKNSGGTTASGYVNSENYGIAYKK